MNICELERFPVRPTCCAKMRSSTETMAFSCHQELRVKDEGHTQNSL